MILSLATSLVISLVIAGSPTEWEPLLSDSAVSSGQAAAEQPHILEHIASELWLTSEERAAIDLLRGYIAGQVVFGEDEAQGSARQWWELFLIDNPRVAAGALAHLDTEFVVWDISVWPPDRKEYLPRYRQVLCECLFESFAALEAEIVRMQTEIQAFPRVSLAPPEGLPARTHPSSVKDPALRADYENRLAEEDRQEYARVVLHELQNLRGELLVSIAENPPVLFAGASDAEVSQLATMICERGWAASPLTAKINGHWPVLAERLAALCKED